MFVYEFLSSQTQGLRGMGNRQSDADSAMFLTASRLPADWSATRAESNERFAEVARKGSLFRSLRTETLRQWADSKRMRILLWIQLYPERRKEGKKGRRKEGRETSGTRSSLMQDKLFIWSEPENWGKEFFDFSCLLSFKRTYDSLLKPAISWSGGQSF